MILEAVFTPAFYPNPRDKSLIWVNSGRSAPIGQCRALITLHALGVLVASLLQRKNLIKAIITGRKPMA
jgi:hypothetical protein